MGFVWFQRQIRQQASDFVGGKGERLVVVPGFKWAEEGEDELRRRHGFILHVQMNVLKIYHWYSGVKKIP